MRLQLLMYSYREQVTFFYIRSFYNREPPQERERHKNHRFRLATLPVYHAFEPPSKLISIQKGYRPMDFMSSVSWGGAFNSV